MAELKNWLDELNDSLDEKTKEFIFNTLVANQFCSRLQLKLLNEDHIKTIFPNLPLGTKSVLCYHLEMLKQESPLPMPRREKAKNKETPQQRPEARRVSQCEFVTFGAKK